MSALWISALSRAPLQPGGPPNPGVAWGRQGFMLLPLIAEAGMELIDGTASCSEGVGLGPPPPRGLVPEARGPASSSSGVSATQPHLSGEVLRSSPSGDHQGTVAAPHSHTQTQIRAPGSSLPPAALRGAGERRQEDRSNSCCSAAAHVSACSVQRTWGLRKCSW